MHKNAARAKQNRRSTKSGGLKTLPELVDATKAKKTKTSQAHIQNYYPWFLE
jgi:hypothetical protein